jgi:CRP/FNR family transcriptional regulator, cyclic AMP receptor protein
MEAIDVLGYAASAFVVLTFYMKEMVALRTAALCSNVCFLAYGLSLKLGPVVVLHAALIPINLWRLWQVLSCGEQPYLWLTHQRLQLLMKRVTGSR